jgi:hypothetical protein
MKARDKTRVTVAEMRFMRQVAKYTLMNYKEMKA